MTTINKPIPREDEILIRVVATTVNRTDCAVLTGRPFLMRFFTGLFRPKKSVTGTDFAGVVESVGVTSTRFVAGDRVWGFDDEGLGSHAEYLAIKECENVSLIPVEASFAEAAASLEAAHYAYNFIKCLSLDSSQRVLVNGASGGIGSALLQLLKAQGLYVTAVTGTKSLALIRSLGADEVVDYQQVDFTSGTGRYDLILDAVGKSSFRACRHLLKPRGIYLSSELGRWCQNPALAVITSLSSGKSVRFPVPKNIAESMEFVKQLLGEKLFRPVIDRHYPLEQIAEAFDYVESGEKIGNVIICIDA